ncbi:hypothetical protein EDD58_102423 [Hazenella coriacea]|uniref:Uncharacterized protein n=1 Tax=Hazenella coriacea TaxID=1179467 RepID=A0A4R3L7C1_9BACL|nr:hypothetical protein EDD58_102423 [Hazenella coriacea]
MIYIHIWFNYFENIGWESLGQYKNILIPLKLISIILFLCLLITSRGEIIFLQICVEIIFLKQIKKKPEAYFSK